ncbi:SusC/RagA family TonB-linked outer membrane protein [Zhouia sp. PK063]|uniref:SusC/RagA family TonB-linked outer membrane protein n=1 Tax=Zhouia sp. PK063 TaxID=3373602 RepID=UPI00378EB242
MMKKVILLIIFFTVTAMSFAQRREVTGQVVSSDGEILFGVNILVKGTQNGTLTDEYGKYKINITSKDTLEFSYIGFSKKVVAVGNQRTINVTMTIDQGALDEVIVVGYGKTKRITNTGAVSSIKAEEVKYVPTATVQNALAGRIPGIITQQRSGQPGRDASDFYIRGVSSLNAAGNRPLIIVDDIEYSYDQLQQININEIESISILKDASTTAIYGIKGANGVLVIKTKRGREGTPRVNVRVESGIQTPVREPNFLGAYQTAQLVNEAYTNDGLQPQFSDADLEHFRTGDDPYGHPDVDWYHRIFKNIAHQENANVDISGGTEKLKYFLSAGAFSQNGLVRDFSSANDDINNNYFYRRFNYRANIDYDVSKTLSLRLDMTSRFGNINQPHNKNVVSEIYDFSKIHPYSAPFLNPNGTYSYAYDTKDNLATINARLANGGYDRIRRTDTNILLGATQKLDFLTDGLEATMRIAYSSIDETNRSVIRETFPTYHYNPVTDTYTIDPRGNYAYGEYNVEGGQSISYQNLNIQGFLNYNHTFNEVNNVNASLIYNRQSSTSGADVPSNFKGYTAQLHYDYANKYLIDLNGAYNGTDRFEASKRYGFFPALGLGYTISEEDFFKDKFPNIQLLKLKASYGLVGSDAAFGDRYLYRQVYYEGGGYNFGYKNYQSVYEGSLGNNNVTWEKSRKTNVGVELKIFNKLSLDINYFYEYRYDQLVYKEDIPAIIGIGTSPTNVATTENKGFDGQISFQTPITKDLNFNTNFTFTYAKNKILYKAEAQKAYPFLQQTGRAIGQPFGYTYIGFYSEADIATLNDSDPNNNVPAPLNDVPIQAGDLKYKDLNGDGVINDFDKGPIGKPNLPSTYLGMSLGFDYKGFSLKALFQGSFGYSFSVIGTGIEPFKSQFQPIHLNRWTPETANSADFPRLTSNPTTVNSPAAYMSDFWLVNAWYVRLKSLDFSYQFPSKMLPFGINNMRAYVSGYNLFTWTSYSKYQQDPEIETNTNGDSYLNQKVMNIGIQIGF